MQEVHVLYKEAKQLMARKNKQQEPTERRSRSVSAKTEGQKTYIKAIVKNEVIVCNGPAGSGKTHIAIGMGFDHYYKGIVNRIVIARPAVESGESLGYLPGGIEDKMAPYVRPIMDELQYYVSRTNIDKMIRSGDLEICPLAYMRGRTFNNAFILCDECQNATESQIKMLFTRLGLESKMVITGDQTQSDLNKVRSGGFDRLYERFNKPLLAEKGIACMLLDTNDIVRNPITGLMLEAWEKEG